MIPFFFLFCLNVLLIHHIIYKRKQTGVGSVTTTGNVKHKSMTRTVMTMTFVFILLTGPYAFMGILKFKYF